MIKVYGASDDLLEVEGDIRAEFSYTDGNEFLAFSDGTILRCTYAGDWSITPLATGQNSVVNHKSAETRREQGDTEAYSDTVTIQPMNGVVRVVVHGNRIGTTRKNV